MKIRLRGMRLGPERKKQLEPLIARLRPLGVTATFYEHVVDETVLEAGIELNGGVMTLMASTRHAQGFVEGYWAALNDAEIYR